MAESILARARKIDTYLETRNIAYPSFDNDTLDQLSGELQDERWALANDVNELKQLSRGAAQNTFDCAFNVSNVLSYLFNSDLKDCCLTSIDIVDRRCRPTGRVSLQTGQCHTS